MIAAEPSNARGQGQGYAAGSGSRLRPGPYATGAVGRAGLAPGHGRTGSYRSAPSVTPSRGEYRSHPALQGSGLRILGAVDAPHPPVAVTGFVAVTGVDDTGSTGPDPRSPASGIRTAHARP
ncbi:hypothetical protein ABZ714_22085 [Streptomyces sp. NPDC006798]|uniref:hypothetical protein n=1 Tax=Streptomyces sp. NPDC006798 TaxID=3155462 RepID=UPI0033D6159D